MCLLKLGIHSKAHLRAIVNKIPAKETPSAGQRRASVVSGVRSPGAHYRPTQEEGNFLLAVGTTSEQRRRGCWGCCKRAEAPPGQGWPCKLHSRNSSCLLTTMHMSPVAYVTNTSQNRRLEIWNQGVCRTIFSLKFPRPFQLLVVSWAHLLCQHKHNLHSIIYYRLPPGCTCPCFSKGTRHYSKTHVHSVWLPLDLYIYKGPIS